jgi:predicted  nucleic acid-binding Zn-ribbon protein
MPNELDNTRGASTPKQGHGHAIAIGVLSVGLVAALAGDGYLLKQSNLLRDDLAQSQDDTKTMISKLNEATSSLLDQRLQSISEDLKATQGNADTAVKRARMEALKQAKDLNARLEDQQKTVTGELTQLKDETTSANSKISDVSSDVSNVKGDVTTVKQDVASTRTDLDQTSSDLKRAVGDMGVMSGLIATNQKDLNALRELGERNYFEFDLKKGAPTQKVGDVTIAMKKSDPKHNRYTVEVLADDKRVEKRDRTINEPVQLYVSDSKQPYEIVVNKIDKDEIVGYLATPKVKIARR